MSPMPEGLAGTEAQVARRQRILDAATTLASGGGFEKVQMRVVADQADVALGTLYRYFPSKIHLLVSVLARELETTSQRLAKSPPAGDTAAERVQLVLGRTTRALQREPDLTEALTRAYMFADASASAEIRLVGVQVTRLLLTGLRPPGDSRGLDDPSPDELAVIRVLGDVWLASLVQWVTGRTSTSDVKSSIETAVRLLLR